MKQCTNCTVQFQVYDEDRAFLDKVSPVFNGVKYSIPEPTYCPDCRQQRRLALCNERHLYPGKCDMCDKKTLTQYPPHTNITTYCRECWHSDKWSALDYGRDVDFNRPFFEQLHELKMETPNLALDVQGNLQNSDYIHYAGSCKNCYLIMHADFCEDCYYGYGFKHNTSCVDGFYNLHSELCYDCIDAHKCYDLKGCQDCKNCSSSAFLRDCIGCKNCFLCVGLRQKEYCFENKQLTKEEYEKKMAEIDLGSHEQYQRCKARLKEIELTHNFKQFQNTNTQNCIGDHLTNCKDLYACFDCEDVETGRYSYQVVTGAKDIYDIYQYGMNLQMSYECAISGENSYHILFSSGVHMNSSDLYYCWYAERSKNCFGCANIQSKQYCILNKQYTKEEYEALVPKIIEHMKSTPLPSGQASEWGEFFPIKDSLFGYNKTTAQIYYPLTKEQALAKRYKWDEYEPPSPQVQKTLQAQEVPDNIKDVSDDALNYAITCEVTGKPFKITPAELKFYRKQNLPIPRRHHDQRHLDRFNKRNPRRFWQKPCDSCQQNMWTTYSPERPEKVYCEVCYEKATY